MAAQDDEYGLESSTLNRWRLRYLFPPAYSDAPPLAARIAAIMLTAISAGAWNGIL